ncbi:MAG: hypothetical protein IID39_09920, partial [Planctomycetes bacterium]|nr:hypothetical protein [Planctomycetota bacterium]
MSQATTKASLKVRVDQDGLHAFLIVEPNQTPKDLTLDEVLKMLGDADVDITDEVTSR